MIRDARVWGVLCAIGIFLLATLLMTSNFHSVDEVAMFATAVSLVDDGDLSINELGHTLWAIRQGEAVTALNDAADLYTKKSPLVTLLLVPLVALGRLLDVNVVRAALWLGPLTLAATAYLLFNVSQELGYGRRTALFATLTLACATMALPYSQLLFSESVTSLALLAAVGLAARAHLRFTQTDTFLYGLCLAAAIGTNSVYLALTLPFVVYWLWLNGRQSLLQAAVLLALPIALVGALLLGYNAIRFGSPLQTGYGFGENGEGFTSPAWWGAAGLLLSPARGLIWYSPPVLLALFGWRRIPSRPLILLILAVTAAHLLVFGAWWSWWGGYGWGPRFLLPLVPLLLLLALPVFEAAAVGERWAGLGVATFFLLGTAVQLGGVAYSFNDYEQVLDAEFPAPANQPLRYHHNPALVYDLAASPILAHWRWLLAGKPTQLGWWLPEEPTAAVAAVNQINDQARPDDVVILLAPEQSEAWLAADLAPHLFGLPVNLPPDDELAQRLFGRALRDAGRVWLVTWYGAGDPANWYEADLRRSWASAGESQIENLRLLLLARPQPNIPWQNGEATFGPLRLRRYRTYTRANTRFVELEWEATAQPTADFISFVHLYQNGGLIAQQDRPPLAGYAPTSGWQPGQIIVDRFAFSELEAAEIHIGWYRWPELERLPVTAVFPVIDNALVLPTE